MASTYNLSHSSGPSAGFPTIYFLAERVTRPSTIEYIKRKIPGADVKVRGRAKQERRITVNGWATQTEETGLTGLDKGAGVLASSALEIEEALEAALLTWKNSGTTTIQLGVNSAGAAKTFTGALENITWTWEPASDDASGRERRKFVLNFLIGSVS